MAFESVAGIKITSKLTGESFIFGDFFAVNDGMRTRIYNWSDIVSVSENERQFEIVTRDSDASLGKKPYVIAKMSFPDIKHQLQVRAIIEGQIAVNPGIQYKHDRRILPLKMLYRNCDPSDDAYVASGAYSEKEINYNNVTLVTAKITKILILVFLVMTAAAFVGADMIFHDLKDNWLKFAAIAVFTGGIVTMFVYMINVIVARSIYASYFKYDNATTEPITFVVCEEGFAAVESDIYTFSDLISWSEANYFIETNYLFMVFNNSEPLLWLPKRLFPENVQDKLSDFIAMHLLQAV